jgi:2-isopropylmalate synthase
MIVRKPFFMDVTLRDGNQALKKPWNPVEKLSVFERLVQVGVQGAEVGFAAASKSDFESIRNISRVAPGNMVLSSLSRAVEREIDASITALKYALRPRVHIVSGKSLCNRKRTQNRP